ncbi:unnamed protein product [Choristocarpus tenellus]
MFTEIQVQYLYHEMCTVTVHGLLLSWSKNIKYLLLNYSLIELFCRISTDFCWTQGLLFENRVLPIIALFVICTHVCKILPVLCALVLHYVHAGEGGYPMSQCTDALGLILPAVLYGLLSVGWDVSLLMLLISRETLPTFWATTCPAFVT